MAKGHYVCYTPRKFGKDALDKLKLANTIIEEYEGQGMAITLRQLYYQFVARGHLLNVKDNYGKLGTLISQGRLAGLVSWTAIEDRGRSLSGYQIFNGPEQAVTWLRERHYHTDLWADQPFRPEVWVEKHALEGVVGSICDELRVNFFAVGGYNSQSAAWRAGRRMARYIQKGQRPIVFHLGDHDPSGLDMTRDNQERLSLFAGSQIQVVRLGLNKDQIDFYHPPPNPAKFKDPRSAAYVREYGDESWELDALEPSALRDLIEEAVLKIRDEKAWDAALQQEAEDKIVLQEMAPTEDPDEEDPEDGEGDEA